MTLTYFVSIKHVTSSIHLLSYMIIKFSHVINFIATHVHSAQPSTTVLFVLALSPKSLLHVYCMHLATVEERIPYHDGLTDQWRSIYIIMLVLEASITALKIVLISLS